MDKRTRELRKLAKAAGLKRVEVERHRKRLVVCGLNATGAWVKVGAASTPRVRGSYKKTRKELARAAKTEAA